MGITLSGDWGRCKILPQYDTRGTPSLLPSPSPLPHAYNRHRCEMLPARHTPKQCWPSRRSAARSWERCGPYGWPCWMRTSSRFVSMRQRRWGTWSALMGRKRSIRSCRSSGDLLPAFYCHPLLEISRKVRAQAWKRCILFFTCCSTLQGANTPYLSLQASFLTEPTI